MSTVPNWFNYDFYMGLKAERESVSLSDLHAIFEANGFHGEEGAFTHFIQYGQYEDVSPTFLFYGDYYYQYKAAHYNDVSVHAVTFEQVTEVRDAIKHAGMSAWSHYQMYGTREGINPSGSFNTSAYMAAKASAVGLSVDELADVFAEYGFSALTHYMECGQFEELDLVGVFPEFLII